MPLIHALLSFGYQIVMHQNYWKYPTATPVGLRAWHSKMETIFVEKDQSLRFRFIEPSWRRMPLPHPLQNLVIFKISMKFDMDINGLMAWCTFLIINFIVDVLTFSTDNWTQCKVKCGEGFQTRKIINSPKCTSTQYRSCWVGKCKSK